MRVARVGGGIGNPIGRHGGGARGLAEWIEPRPMKRRGGSPGAKQIVSVSVENKGVARRLKASKQLGRRLGLRTTKAKGRGVHERLDSLRRRGERRRTEAESLRACDGPP